MLLRPVGNRIRGFGGVGRSLKRVAPLLAASVGLLLGQGEAKAILNINIFDDGPNLKVTVQGSVSQLGSSLGSGACGVDGALTPTIICTGPNSSAETYAILGSGNFGIPDSLVPADTVSGFTFRMSSSSSSAGVRLDSSYVLGQPFFSSATFNDSSLASLGVTSTGLVGTWTIVGTTESINVFYRASSSSISPRPPAPAGRRCRLRLESPSAQAHRHSVDHPAPGLNCSSDSPPSPAIGGAFLWPPWAAIPCRAGAP